MKNGRTVGLMIYGLDEQARDVFIDEKYKGLAEYLSNHGIRVESIVYNNQKATQLREPLKQLDALLVWVNPVENGEDRSVLDALLVEVSKAGVAVSTHPHTIQKIGTKRVLHETKAMDWGSDVELYSSFEDFVGRFMGSLDRSGIRVLKRFRGDSGNGIYKVSRGPGSDTVSVLHAVRGSVEEHLTAPVFYERFRGFFANDQPLINQEWNANITNGMIRCYMCSDKVAGFGYQEIVAFYPSAEKPIPPSRRYYYSENCGLFTDLRYLMEGRWVNQIMQQYQLSADMLPVLWDADFFINDPYIQSSDKYTLCEINVSCVSPFPESAIAYIDREVKRRIKNL